jgi:hypothetical protein
MEPSPRHQVAEAQFRQLLHSVDLAPPDDVTYAPASLTFLWHAPKLAVVVDLDDPEAGCDMGAPPLTQRV